MPNSDFTGATAVIKQSELARQLANTYTGGRVSDPWAQVQEYREYLNFKAKYPNAGRNKLGNMIEVPPSRVRSWNDGSKPDAQKAIEVAESHGWLDATTESRQFRALIALLAWVFSSGSIQSRTYDPYFVATKDTRHCLLSLLEVAGHTETRTNRTNDTDRATEIIPSQHATILGRMLVALGAPLGPKSDITGLSVPDWLTDSPAEIRETFLCTYIWNRGVKRSDRPKTPVQIHEERSERYRHQLRQLIESLVPNGVKGDSNTYRLSAAAASRLYKPPELCDQS